jgi:hypothetical protein
MCDPVTLTIAATAVAATGKVVSGVGQAQQYRYQAKVDQQNARLANDQARDSIDNTTLEAQRRYRQLAQTKGAQTASMAANGVDLNFGSAVDLQEDTAMIGAEDVGQIYKGGNERTKGFEINAYNYRSSAAGNKAKARGAIIGSVFEAAGTALAGASQVSRMKAGRA